MSSSKSSRVLTLRDFLAAALLCGVTVLIFGAGADRLGFAYEDSGWISGLTNIEPRDLWAQMLNFTPGRPLFVLWEYLLLQLVGEPAAHLGALHLIQSGLDGLIVAGFFLLLRMLDLPPAPALMAAAVFAFWPTHGETHFFQFLAIILVTAAFVILFSMTSIALARRGAAKWWAIDAAALVAALFTYDQAFFVLAGLVLLRVTLALRSRRWGFVVAHVPYVLIGYGYLSWKLAAPSAMRPNPSVVWSNLLTTLAQTAGRSWWQRVEPLYEKVVAGDWVLAGLSSAAVLVLALRWSVGPGESSATPAGRVVTGILACPPASVFALAVMFYATAYLPVWLWNVSPRHHYLPSIGLFGAFGAALAWTLERLANRGTRLLLLVGVATSTAVLAAANRGESRYWEQAFALKQQLFADLRGDLPGKEVFVLEDFPVSWGPAYFMTPQDAALGPRLLYGRSIELHPRFAADVGSVAAPGGIFLFTLGPFHGSESFRYYPTTNFLIARYAGFEGGRLRYEKNPKGPLHYQVLHSSAVPSEGGFAVLAVSARREGNDTIVEMRLRASLHPEAHLAATLGFRARGEFHPWTRLRPQGAEVLPVLLSEGGPGSTPGSRVRTLALRLGAFPRTDRISIDFFEARRDAPPARLGRAEVAVEP